MGMNEQITAAALLHPLAELTDLGRGRQRPCVFVRANAPVFYSLGAASLLETTTLGGIEKTLQFSSHDPAFSEWLHAYWIPRRLARVRRLQEYILLTWPEFDWSS